MKPQLREQVRETGKGMPLPVRKSGLLAAAFAALLLAIGLAGFAAWRNATIAQGTIASLHSAHLRAGAALAAIRANIYLSGILTRDYLLDPDPSHGVHYVEQFQGIRQSTEESFRTLESAGHDQLQRAALDRLRREVMTYWDPTEMALDWTPEEKNARRYTFLRQRVRRREDVFALARQVEDLMTANFTRERERITHADRELRQSLGWTALVAVLFGICIAAATLIRMVALERQSEGAASELRRLSGQLRTAQEEERKFLSRELHDQVGQMLTGLKMQLAGLARLAAGDSGFRDRIAEAKSGVEEALRTVRNIAMVLRPSMLDDLGLTPALAWHIREFSKNAGVAVESEIDPAADALPDAFRTCIYRVVQEALTNCARHARAAKVTVRIQMTGESVLARIADDGAGFDIARRKGRGLGLVGMEERVLELNGQLRIVTAPGAGTRIEVRLPRPPADGSNHDSDSDRGRSRDCQGRAEAAV